jgi:hypothetical protein
VHGRANNEELEQLGEQVQCLGYGTDEQDDIPVRDPFFVTFSLLD